MGWHFVQDSPNRQWPASVLTAHEALHQHNDTERTTSDQKTARSWTTTTRTPKKELERRMLLRRSLWNRNIYWRSGLIPKLVHHSPLGKTELGGNAKLIEICILSPKLQLSDCSFNTSNKLTPGSTGSSPFQLHLNMCSKSIAQAFVDLEEHYFCTGQGLTSSISSHHPLSMRKSWSSKVAPSSHSLPSLQPQGCSRIWSVPQYQSNIVQAASWHGLVGLRNQVTGVYP